MKFENCQPETGTSVEKCQAKPVRCGCGGEAKAWEFMNGQWYVKCQKCGIGQFFAYRSEAEAIEAWNRAMGEDKVDELIEHIWREKLDTREAIANLVKRMMR